MRPPAVKICGITDPEDGRAAGLAGADYVGAILTEGFRRSVQAPTARRVAEAAGCPLVVVLVDPSPGEAAEIAAAARAAVVQLHGDEPAAVARRIRAAGPWRVWKALRVRVVEDLESGLERYGDAVDGLLVDGWHPNLRGGAGVRFPWEAIAPVRGAFPPGLHFIAAGGLDPDNVEHAVRTLRPDVVDVSSGVESSPGRKDPGLVRAFIERGKAIQPENP